MTAVLTAQREAQVVGASATPVRMLDSAPSLESDPPVLAIDGLTVEVATPDGPLSVVEDVCLNIRAGETLGLVGESGSGKSVTSLAIMRLLSSPPFSVVSGSVRLEGRDIIGLEFDEVRRLRGQDMSMIFQDPMASLNPALTVGFQLVEAIRVHDRVSRHDARRQSVELLSGSASPIRPTGSARIRINCRVGSDSG